MPITTSGYLDDADRRLAAIDKKLQLARQAGRRDSEDVSAEVAIAQVKAMQAVAVAIDHLAAAVESTQRTNASNKVGSSPPAPAPELTLRCPACTAAVPHRPTARPPRPGWADDVPLR